MRRLFDSLRPQTDLSAQPDSEDDDSLSHPSDPGRRHRWVLAVLLCLLGAGLIAGAVVIGIQVEGDLTEPIRTRRSEIWAGVPLLLFVAGGALVGALGIRLLRDLIATRLRGDRR